MSPSSSFVRSRPLFASIGLVGVLAFACGHPSSPGVSRDGSVVDEAGLLTPDSEARLERLLAELHSDLGVDLVACTVTDLGGAPIERLATSRFDAWDVGRETEGRGALLVVAEHEQRVRLEVGYALESALPDQFVAYVERDQMAPWFADGRIGPGVEATVELLADRLYANRSDDLASATDGDEPLSGGAGARSSVRFEGGSERSVADPSFRDRFGAQPTPLLAWETFLATNRLHVEDPDLGIYDETARRRMRGTVSSAGQDHLAKLYEGASPTVRQRDDRAVILFLDDPDHRLAPWFFRRAAVGWQLDGAAVTELVAYNHRNQWHFRTLDHPYRFAFEDFRFDENGFAFPPALLKGLS